MAPSGDGIRVLYNMDNTMDFGGHEMIRVC